MASGRVGWVYGCIALAGCALPNGSVAVAQSCLIISEVVDGNRSGGNPKFIEITNTGSTPYSFTAGGIIVQSNSATDRTVDVPLTGVTIDPGRAYVVAGSLNDGLRIFPDTYGFEADLTHPNITGNGDDRYILTDTADGSHLLDIYGQIDTPGGGTAWEYTDGYAYRLPAVNSGNGGVFKVEEWYIARDALKGLNDAENKALLLQHTTPKQHAYAPGCGAPITGACCRAATCSIETEAACGAGGDGVFRGVGTLCAPDPCVCRGDANCDSHISYADINPFIRALGDPNTACSRANCDVNGDGAVNYADINPFVQKLGATGPCL